MPVVTRSAVPRIITAGDTIIFSIGANTLYPNTDWTLKFALSQNGLVQRSLAAASADSGLGFLVTLPAIDTAKLIPGLSDAALVYTEASSGQRATDACSVGQVMIVPDPTQSLPESDSAKALKAVNAAIAQVAAEPYASVNFNGQSYNAQNLKDLFYHRDRLVVIVSAELAELGIGSRRGGAKMILARFR